MLFAVTELLVDIPVHLQISSLGWYIKVIGSWSRSQELKNVSVYPVPGWSVFY